jgi:hypothetical protein
MTSKAQTKKKRDRRHLMNLSNALRRPTVPALALLLAAAASLATGCGPSTTPPDDPAGIVGAITSITPATATDIWGSILVEGGEQPTGAVSDKASVTISDETTIVRDGVAIGADDLAVGMTVRVWFEGPVAESYPVQGTASFIEVE